MKTILYALAFLLFSVSSLHAETHQVMHLHLQGEGHRAAPLLLTIELRGERIVAALATEPYRRNPIISESASQLATDELKWSGDRLTGRVQIDDLTITLDARAEEAVLRGNFTVDVGQERRKARLFGALSPLPALDQGTHLTLYMNHPYPGFPSRRDVRIRHVRGILALQMRDGQVTSGRFESHFPNSTHHSGPVRVTDVAVAGARVARLSVAESNRMTWRQSEGDWTKGSLRTQVRTENGQLVTYHLEFRIIGDTVIGEYHLEGEGVEENHRDSFVGHWGVAGHLSPEKPDIPDAGRGEVELRHHLNWLYENPYVGGLFGSDYALAFTSDAGSKNYDNPPMAGGSGPISMILLARLTDDPLIKAQAMMAAHRAGHYLYSNRTGPLNLLRTYKGMFWMHFWMGRAYLELYQATGDPFWRERTVELAEALRQTQTPEGSWNWVEPGSGRTGTSNSRNDRSWDNIPLQCGDWLYFLGQLRHAGIEGFVDIERKAAAWMHQAVEQGVVHNDRDYLWRGRAPSSRFQALGPSFYSLYLLKYAEEFDADHLAKVLGFVEENLWEIGEDRLPLIQTYFTRSPGGTHTMSTMRMARVYLLAAERTGNSDYRRRAGQLYHTLLTGYDERSGLIWNDAVPADWNGYARMMRHPYTVFQSDLAYQLDHFITTGKKAAGQGRPVPLPQVIDFPEIENVAAMPARITPAATSTSGLPIEYTIDRGPANIVDGRIVLTGEKGIVWVTASQPGDDRFIPALTVQRTFAVGDASPPPVAKVEADSLNVRTVRLRWQPSTSEDVIAYHIESSRDEGRTWRRVGQVDAQTTQWEARDHRPGETRRYRVIAANPELTSEPSSVVAIASHARPYRVKIHAADVKAGEKWELQEFDDIPGGEVNKALVALDNVLRGDDVPEPYWFSFEIDIGDQPGRYRVWYMCWGNSGANDSAWFRVNDRPFHGISVTNAFDWEWRSVDVELDRPGKHTIAFGARQSTTSGGTPAPRIAYIVVTNSSLQQE
ncbi:MAG: AGE family epimerase/isomerase [Phycisphaeraceae bacterium]|nr:AGE family epimerase/isomerase [Phycisphaeraceae bacterium]